LLNDVNSNYVYIHILIRLNIQKWILRLLLQLEIIKLV